MISEITDAICVVDHEDRVVWANSTFHDWFSHRGHMLGKKISSIMPGLPDACLVGKVLSDVDANNRKRYFEVECIPTFDENNVKVSDLIAFRDVTVLQTLLDISDLTVSTTSPEELLNKAVDIIGETLGYKTIAALKHESGGLELVASRGYSPMLRSLLAKQKVSPDEKGLAGRSAFHNKIIIKEVKEGSVSDKLFKESKRLGISTVITIPLIDRGVLVGVLAVSTSAKPTAEQVNLLKIMCNQLAVSLRKTLFEEELVKARDEMELYIDLMCHDITNANQVALGYLELLQDKTMPGGEQYVNCAMATIYRVNTLIDNVRKIRKAHALTVERISLKEPLDKAIREVGCIVESMRKKITIESAVDTSASVKGNALLRDMFYNILELTVRRINDGGVISISSKDLDGAYELIFEDSGPGIPAGKKEELFTAVTVAPRTGQSGLSVYLLSSLIHSFGGHIQVEDRVKGDTSRGSRIILDLKKA
jgi:signal transduction histidine kinase